MIWEKATKKTGQDLKELTCRSKNAVSKFADNPEILSVTSPHIDITDNCALANKAQMQIGFLQLSHTLH